MQLMTQTGYECHKNRVGQLKVNNNKVMCHLSMKLFDMFNQTTHHTLEKIMAKFIPIKNSLKVYLKPKGQGHRKKQKIIT